MQVKQTIQIAEVLTGDWFGNRLSIVIEGREEGSPLIEFVLNPITARSFAMFLADLCAAPENPMNQAGESR